MRTTIAAAWDVRLLNFLKRTVSKKSRLKTVQTFCSIFQYVKKEKY
jgi:hypothetical protein